MRLTGFRAGFSFWKGNVRTRLCQRNNAYTLQVPMLSDTANSALSTCILNQLCHTFCSSTTDDCSWRVID